MITSDDHGVRVCDVGKAYLNQGRRVSILSGLSARFGSGQVTWLSGPSGSGKTTLLGIIGLLVLPDEGHVEIDGLDTRTSSSTALARIRAERIGFVFQSHNLLERLTVAQNINISLPARKRTNRSAELLEQLGIRDLQSQRAGTLSGGQKMRVALVRALAKEPTVVLADEPTAGLDAETATTVLEILASQGRQGRAVVIASHDPAVASYASRQLDIRELVAASERRG